MAVVAEVEVEVSSWRKVVMAASICCMASVRRRDEDDIDEFEGDSES